MRVLRVSATVALGHLPQAEASRLDALLKRILPELVEVQELEWFFSIKYRVTISSDQHLRTFLESPVYSALQSSLNDLIRSKESIIVKSRIWFQGFANAVDPTREPWRALLDFPLVRNADTAYILSKSQYRPVGPPTTANTPVVSHEIALLLPQCPSEYYQRLTQSGHLISLHIGVGILGNSTDSGLMCVIANAHSLEELHLYPSSYVQRDLQLAAVSPFKLPNLRILQVKHLPARFCDDLLDRMTTPNLRHLISCHNRPSLPSNFLETTAFGFLDRCPHLRVVTLECTYEPLIWEVAVSVIERLHEKLESLGVMLDLQYYGSDSRSLQKGFSFIASMPVSLRPAFSHLAFSVLEFPDPRTPRCVVTSSYTEVTSLFLKTPIGVHIDISRQLEYIFSTFQLPSLRQLAITVPKGMAEGPMDAVIKSLGHFPELHECVLELVDEAGRLTAPCPLNFSQACAAHGIKAGVPQDFSHRTGSLRV